MTTETLRNYHLTLNSPMVEEVVEKIPAFDEKWIRWLIAENFGQLNESDRGGFWRSIAPNGVKTCEIMGTEYWQPVRFWQLSEALQTCVNNGIQSTFGSHLEGLALTNEFIYRLNYLLKGWDYSTRISRSASLRWSLCESCGDWTNDGVRAEDDGDQLFCTDCADRHWWEAGGNWFTHSENAPEYEDRNPLEVWKPDPVFFGDSDSGSFYGLELEVEFENSGQDTRSLIEDLVSSYWLGSNKGLWYHHSDGSLYNGIEFVSHPMSADFLRSDLSLDWLQYLRREGLRSWNTSTCGLHIHTSRAGFASDVHAFAFAQLFYQNAHQFERLAGRSSSRFASFDLEDRPPLALDIKRRASSGNRYVAVNFTNYATVEVRIFRGSLNETRVRSALELVSGAVEYTREITVRDLNSGALDWARFVAFLESNNAPNALEYINLYDLKGK
jgi:hypothetical protein